MPLIVLAFPAVIDCDTLIFRALRPRWIEQGKISSDAFILRRFDDGTCESGLSVGCTAHASAAHLTKIKFVSSFHVGRIRSVALDVIADEEGSNHAEIRGLPHPDDELAAERMATKLLRQARPVEL